ncbi:hypothetical protein CEXT_20381 [Caerostris extrusa]|uniref:Uncharacterized protein n=1 Tax=Caerostris extrusa TaxID=172846 RepID=A0AAV4N0P5_CAEEX|nr:hypothetical protein CEXT_20381 [Caerostris extrusa]
MRSGITCYDNVPNLQTLGPRWPETTTAKALIPLRMSGGGEWSVLETIDYSPLGKCRRASNPELMDTTSASSPSELLASPIFLNESYLKK